MKKYYFTTPVQKDLFNKSLFDEKEASTFGEKEVKRLIKEDGTKKHLYGYEIKQNGSYIVLYITTCKILSNVYSLKEIDELSANPDNEKHFLDKKIVVSHKYNKTIFSQPIILNDDKKYITPIYIEKELHELINEDDINFIIELTRKFQNYHFLNKNIEVLEDALRKRSFNNKMSMSFMEAVFDLYYRLIINNCDSSYINGYGAKIEYNYNSLRKFGLFVKDYVQRKQNKQKEKAEETKPLTLALKLDESYSQIKMEGF